MSVLIIDDAITAQTMTLSYLKALGFRHLRCARHGHEALGILRDEGFFDLILLDWNMPCMDGLEFMRVFQSWPGADQSKVLMMTTEIETERVREALEVGVHEYLMKPFDLGLLHSKLMIMGVKLLI